MKKVLLSLFIMLGSMAHADDLKTAFVPINGEYGTPSFGQDESGGFICYGKLSKVPFHEWYHCDEATYDIAGYVKKEFNGKYIGSNFLYDNTALMTSYSRSGNAYTIHASVTGLIVFYKAN